MMKICALYLLSVSGSLKWRLSSGKPLAYLPDLTLWTPGVWRLFR